MCKHELREFYVMARTPNNVFYRLDRCRICGQKLVNNSIEKERTHEYLSDGKPHMITRQD